MVPKQKRPNSTWAGPAMKAKAASSGTPTAGAPVWKRSQRATSGAAASEGSSQNGVS